MPPPRAISASFHRGGTSRGLLLRASVLSAYSPSVRSNIIRTALGSPDPFGRQIDGLGGGVSSLSKCAVVGLPGEGKEQAKRSGAMEGVNWANDGEKEGVGKWDVVYRFCQVGVRDRTLDWSSTCGNLLSAVALHSLTSPSLIPYSTLFSRARSLPPPAPGSPLMFPLSILSASNGALMRARVPLNPISLEPWELGEEDLTAGKGVEIAGVPGKAPGIEVELPLKVDKGAPAAGEVFEIEFEGLKIPYSVLSSGLPNILLPLSSLCSSTSLSIDPSLLTSPASSLTQHPTLLPFLERLRQTISNSQGLPFSLSSPKIVLIGPVPSAGYDTSSAGVRVEATEADLVARTISSGDVHATIPATTLACLAIGAGTPGSLVSHLMAREDLTPGKVVAEAEEGVMSVRVGNAAGVAESAVRFERGGDGRVEPRSVVMVRTAREIMRGQVMVPERCFAE